MARRHHPLTRKFLLSGLLCALLGGCTSGAVSRTGTYPAEPSARPDRSGEPATRAPSITDGLSPAGRSLVLQGRDQRAAGQYGQAAASLERAIRIEPAQPAPWLELGQIRLLEGDFGQAEQLGRKARSLAGRDTWIESRSLRLIADALRGMGRHDEARQLDSRPY